MCEEEPVDGAAEEEPVDGAAEEDDFDGKAAKAENGGGRLSLWEPVVVAGFSPLEPVGGGRLGVKPAPRKVGTTFGGMMDLEGGWVALDQRPNCKAQLCRDAIRQNIQHKQILNMLIHCARRLARQ